MAKSQARRVRDERKSITEPPELRPGVSELHKEVEPEAGSTFGHHDSHGQDHAPDAAGLSHGQHHPYVRLAAMAVLSFIAMYVLMYAMVDRSGNVINSLNQVYMAGLMTAPMVLLELLLMRAMYPDRNANLVISIVSVVAMAILWFAIRGQWAIGDQQFLRSMIPHHAGAVLMCREAPITDERIAALCQEIIAGQEREIEQMKALLAPAA